MNEDPRLREGLQARAGPSGSVAADTDNGVYAALDLGTNNCRLLIASPPRRRLSRARFLFADRPAGRGRFHRPVRISEAAIDRAIAALRICSDKIRYRKAGRLRLIATEACRAAANAESFRDRVAAETGIRLEVIDRETEATLGRDRLLAAARRRRAAVPSCSISAADRPNWSGSSATRPNRNARPRIQAWMSIPLGVVTLGRAFGGRDVDAGDLTRTWCARSRSMSRRSRPSMALICTTCTCSAPRAP